MKRFRTSLAAKTAAVLLALAVGAGGFWSTVFILYQWDTLWLGSGYYDSNDYYSDLYNRSSQVRELARLLQNQEWNGALPYLDQRRLDMLEEALSPERTNFRFAIRRNDTGTLVYSNLEGAASLDESVHAVEQEELSLTPERGRPRAGLCGLEREGAVLPPLYRPSRRRWHQAARHPGGCRARRPIRLHL